MPVTSTGMTIGASSAVMTGLGPVIHASNASEEKGRLHFACISRLVAGPGEAVSCRFSCSFRKAGHVRGAPRASPYQKAGAISLHA
jgi:hypothetical protein